MITVSWIAAHYRLKPAEVRFLKMAQRLADEAEDPAEGAEILRQASISVDWERFGTAEEWRALLLDLRSVG